MKGLRTPWMRWIRSAAQMGIAPDAFWKLSLREWRALTARQAAQQAMTRRELDALMAVVERDKQDGGPTDR
ncbi:MAG: hypothetical protein CME88_13215 [Hirschia sp.]|nr:hypothetical protein [Hirschia sp.]MBF19329.1 hypothetical protein [Hirschia sp.]